MQTKWIRTRKGGRQRMTNPMDKISQFTDSVPVNIEAAIKSLGISLQKNANLTPGIAGHIKRTDHDSYEIASTQHDHYFRQRFTLAHELGHYVLHRSLIGVGIDDDTKYRSTELGEFYNTSIEDVHERQANSFAANVLMPEQKVRDAVHEGRRTLKDVAREFQVSPSAMRWRLKNLGLGDFVDDPDG